MFLNAGEPDVMTGDYRRFSEDHGITEIGIERTPCYGKCATYTFIVKSDGTVRYNGEAHVDRIGRSTGKIPTWEFHWLANFIVESGFMELHRAYATLGSDLPTVYTMVVMNGDRKIVSSFPGSGPYPLWAVEKLIDDLSEEVEWDP
jgi:hypothetical protein